MVHFLQCSKAQMPLPLLLSILLLLINSMELVHSDAASRLPLRLLETDIKGKETRGEKMAGRALIGSRPPRCERVCVSCGHCEAVQVPIVPQDQRRAARTDQEHIMTTTGDAISYRVNGLSNYKPLSWKCKCGGTIFDP